MNNTIKIYLAGGMRSGWQDRVIEKIKECYGDEMVEFLDPRSHGLKEPAEYTKWDMNAIENCDVVFGYMEKDNPAGMNLMYEMGYGKGLGKEVFCVDEKAAADERHDRYTKMIQCSTLYCRNIDDGMDCLLGFIISSDNH